MWCVVAVAPASFLTHVCVGAFGEFSTGTHSLLKVSAYSAALKFWREAGAKSLLAARAQYTATYRRRWGCAAALQGARLRIARRTLVEGQRQRAAGDTAMPAGPMATSTPRRMPPTRTPRFQHRGVAPREGAVAPREGATSVSVKHWRAPSNNYV